MRCNYRAISLLAVVAFLSLQATAIANAAGGVPTVGDLRRIDVVATWGGLGPAEYAHTIILRRGTEFVVDDQPVQTTNIDALVSALVAQPQEKPYSDSVSKLLSGYEIDYASRESLQRCIGAGADLDGVRASFKRLFYDRQNQRQWLTDEYDPQNFHTDDYPGEQVTLTFEDGSTISASSRSQKLLMLPFDVTRNDSTFTTFNDRIPHAIAALTVGGVNSDRLSGGESLISAYGDWLCEAFRGKIELAVLRAWAPEIATFIASHGIVTEDLRLGDDLGTLYGRFYFPAWPRNIVYQLQVQGRPLDSTSITAASLKALRQANERVDFIMALPWVRHWYQTAQSPHMLLEPFVGGNNSFDWQLTVADLKSMSPIAYAAVQQCLRAVVHGMMWQGERKESTRWLFLPSGDAVALDSDRGNFIDPQGNKVHQRQRQSSCGEGRLP